MKKLEVETKRPLVVQGLNPNNILEVEDPREVIVTGEQTNLVIEKQTDSKNTLYMTAPQTIIIQQQRDVTETVYV